MKTVYNLILSGIFITISFHAWAQCTVASPPTSAACGSVGQTALPTSGSTTINSGSTYYYSSASSASVAGLTINGGTLLVCGPGTLTLSTPVMSSGTIIVEPGATLTISDMPHGASPNAIQTSIVNYGTLNINAVTNIVNIPVNAAIWNYATMNVNASLTFNSNPFYNALTTSTATILGDLTTYGAMVNNGKVQVNRQYQFTNGGVCLGGGSNFSADSLFDNGPKNAVTVTPNGSQANAGFTVQAYYASNSNALTSSSNVVFCAGPSMTNNNGNYGNATVEPNCTSIVLPVTLMTFSAEEGVNNTCILQWTTARESGVKDFDLEYSLNGSDFVSLAVITAHNEPSSYSYPTVLDGRTWFRLRIDNVDGTYSYSPVVMAEYDPDKSGPSYSIRIQPNIITNNTLIVWANMKTAQAGKWLVVDMMGRTLLEQDVQLSAGSANIDIRLPALASGMYRLLFAGSQVRISPVPFSVIR